MPASLHFSLKTAAYEPEMYTPSDFQIGATINVYGRNVLLYDCDEFTKYYYNTNYGVEDFTPIKVDEVGREASLCHALEWTQSLSSGVGEGEIGMLDCNGD